jgi:hypothetical protein
VSESNLPSASIENESLRLEYLTTTGPRIVGLYSKVKERNILAETPDVHWSTPHGEYYPRGGHRLWTAPEDPFYTAPEDGLQVIQQNNTVTLQSPVDAACLQKEISIRLDGNRVHLVHRVTWHGAEPVELAPWSISQLRLGGLAILPLPHQDGLLPDRKIVLWPYAKLHDVRFELWDDMLLLYGRGLDEAFKVGTYNTLGWIAYALGNILFMKKFDVDHSRAYPDLGCNVEAYVKDSCVELETLGSLTTLHQGSSASFDETWEVLVGDYPVTPASARNIIKQHSQF